MTAKAVVKSSRMPITIENDMLFRELQFLEEVLYEIPEEQLKKQYAILVQQRIVDIHRILYPERTPT